MMNGRSQIRFFFLVSNFFVKLHKKEENMFWQRRINFFNEFLIMKKKKYDRCNFFFDFIYDFYEKSDIFATCLGHRDRTNEWKRSSIF